MSPLEQIKEGLSQCDLEMIRKGYEQLTGESLLLPNLTTPNQLHAQCVLQEIADLARQVLHPETEEPKKVSKKKTSKKNAKKTIPKSRVKKTKKKTTVTKDGIDSSVQIADKDMTPLAHETDGVRHITNEPDIEEVAQNIKRSARSRPNKLRGVAQTTATYDVKCNECEKTFESDRPGGEMGQKCKKCLRSKKSMFS